MYHKTIIIGGGIAGLACARTLHDAGEDFLLLAKELGGRMQTSPEGINLGASYVTEDYTNALRFIKKGEHISVNNCYFLNHEEYTTLLHWRIIPYIIPLLRLLALLNDFRKRIRRLRRGALHAQQIDLLHQDSVLLRYTKMPATQFVQKYSLEYLNRIFFSPLFTSTGFMSHEKANAFFYLFNLLPMVSRTYTADMRNTIALLAKGLPIKITTVQTLHRKGRNYLVRSFDRTYEARNVVLALPYPAARKIWSSVPSPAHINPVYVFYVIGRRKKEFAGKKVVFFRQQHPIFILWEQRAGGDIIFSKKAQLPWQKYYHHYRMVKRIFWDPAVMLSDEKWVPQKLAHGLYIASDYNMCSLEDCCIAGIYAANQIIHG